MNEAHRALLKNNFINAVEEYCKAFCNKQGWEYDGYKWSGNIGGRIEINGMMVDFSDIRTDIDYDFIAGKYEEWYKYKLRLESLGLPVINYWVYAKGFPLTYTEEQLKKLEKKKLAKKGVVYA